MVWLDQVWYGMVWYGVVWYGMVVHLHLVVGVAALADVYVQGGGVV